MPRVPCLQVEISKALKADGSVVTWGDPSTGGDSGEAGLGPLVPADLKSRLQPCDRSKDTCAGV